MAAKPALRIERDTDDGAAGRDAWVARIPCSDAAAFEVMVNQFAAPLRRFAYRYTRSREAAAELVQDVFYKVWTNRGGVVFGSRVELRAYLYRVTRNGALDYLAREHTRWRHRKASREATSERIVPLHAAPANVHAELAELAAMIDRVLAEMPDRRRAVCLLRWRHGLSVAEIAERLIIAPKTVEVQIGRGLRQLKDRLDRTH